MNSDDLIRQAEIRNHPLYRSETKNTAQDTTENKRDKNLDSRSKSPEEKKPSKTSSAAVIFFIFVIVIGIIMSDPNDKSDPSPKYSTPKSAISSSSQLSSSTSNSLADISDIQNKKKQIRRTVKKRTSVLCI